MNPPIHDTRFLSKPREPTGPHCEVCGKRLRSTVAFIEVRDAERSHKVFCLSCAWKFEATLRACHVGPDQGDTEHVTGNSMIR